MKKTEKAILIEGLRKLSAATAELAAALEGKAVAEPEPVPESVKVAEPEPAYSFEDVRAILADKARSGYRAEVKAILTAHGASKLSDITDPAELAKIAAEAEGVGVDG